MFLGLKLPPPGRIANRRFFAVPWGSIAAGLLAFAGISLPAMAQGAPTISSISPSTVTAGGAGFTLTVTGSGYAATSVVQINGSNRPTTYVNAQQLTAAVLASDIAAPGSLNVTVLNTSTAGVVSSNSVTLTVVVAASPVLTGVSPQFATQGVTQLNVTLVGANFRPGATVIISPPLASLSASNGRTPAGDVTVQNITVVNSGLITAQVNLSPNAVLGLRAVDVLNRDGTSTVSVTPTGASGTSQSMRISPTNSIGSPLTVLNMALMHPRDGSVVTQGDQLNADAILAGTGTGTVIGEWVWDGNVVEQFSAAIVGGQSAAIRTRQSLPTWYLGAHTLLLRMLQPNQVTSRPIEVVVNPGKWKLEQLIQPAYGAVFAFDAPPHLLWAIVPGALKYQVGFSAQPYFSTIVKWFDVTENQWQVPGDVWRGLPEGKLYWTVRTVDDSGEPRKPLPMRVIYRSPQGKQNSPGPSAMRPARGGFMRAGEKYNPRAGRRPMMPMRISLPLAGRIAQPPAVAAGPSEPTPAPAKGETDAEAPPSAKSPAPRHGPSEDGQIGINTQWASGSNPADSNALSVSEHALYQVAPWTLEVNGSGLLNSILNPPPQRTSDGKVNNYVGQIGFQRKAWTGNLQFGIVTPALYNDAQFVSEPTARQGVQLALKTPAGAFSGFTNTDDAAAGGGSGINVRQQIIGASWQAPLPKWAQLRLMWLSAADLGAVTPRASGDVYGGLLTLQLNKQWSWVSEYGVSHDNANTGSSASIREFGRAWRTGITGQPGKTNVSIAYRDVSANFGNPANPGLTPDSQANVRGVNSSITQATRAGSFGLTYTFLANNLRPVTSDELLLNTFEETWSKALDVKTNVSLDARQSLTRTGTVPAALKTMPPAATGAQDIRDVSGSVNLSRQVGSSTLSLGAQRDWNHNTLFPTASTITSSLNAGSNLVTQGFFQLNSQVSVSWVAGDGFTVGTSRTVSLNLQPALVWKRPGLQLAPLVTVTKGQTLLSSGTLSSDTLTGQYGGRVAWTLPRVLKFSTLSAQGSYNQNRNMVTGINQPATQLLAILTTSWGHKHTF